MERAKSDLIHISSEANFAQLLADKCRRFDANLDFINEEFEAVEARVSALNIEQRVELNRWIDADFSLRLDSIVKTWVATINVTDETTEAEFCNIIERSISENPSLQVYYLRR